MIFRPATNDPLDARHRRPRHGFTLVELMISIALVLLLMIGVNEVFKMTGDATGAGQAISAAVRDGRAAQAMFNLDLANLASDSPCILLHSQVTPAFRNRADELADRDYNPAGTLAQRQAQILSLDVNGNNQEGETNVPGEVIPPAILNSRNHRTDIFSFFARGLYRRQTGNTAQGTFNTESFAADMSSREAWIWYGHLWQPNNTGTVDRYFIDGSGRTIPTFPGAGTFSTNPNNLYATQWSLGRVAMLLRTPTAGAVTDNAGNQQQFIVGPINAALPLAPLQTAITGFSGGSTDNNTSNPRYQIYQSRYDLAGISMSDFKTALSNFLQSTPQQDWWNRLMLTTRINDGGGPRDVGMRFQCDPFLFDSVLGRRALNSRTTAIQSPQFVQSCTQFIVEYAGDFVSQDDDPTSATFGEIGTRNSAGVFTPGATGVPWQATGSPYPPANGSYVSDGQIDFIVDNPGTTAARKRIRWYGLPRDTDGDGIIKGVSTAGPNNPNDLVDVVPLRDIIRTVAGYNAFLGAPFEKLDATGRFTPQPAPSPTLAVPAGGRYADPANPAAGMRFNEYYTCAWGPSDSIRPKMIRIVMTIDDPNGRIGEGQTFEYVFKLP